MQEESAGCRLAGLLGRTSGVLAMKLYNFASFIDAPEASAAGEQEPARRGGVGGIQRGLGTAGRREEKVYAGSARSLPATMQLTPPQLEPATTSTPETEAERIVRVRLPQSFFAGPSSLVPSRCCICAREPCSSPATSSVGRGRPPRESPKRTLSLCHSRSGLRPGFDRDRLGSWSVSEQIQKKTSGPPPRVAGVQWKPICLPKVPAGPRVSGMPSSTSSFPALKS
jgi:hypothetical protein